LPKRRRKKVFQIHRNRDDMNHCITDAGTQPLQTQTKSVSQRVMTKTI
jgi:hypothetical protein